MIDIFSPADNRVFSLIDLVRTNPILYLGKKSITLFSAQMAGYIWACEDHKTADISFLPLDIFQAWVYIKYKNKMMISFDKILLMACNNDEERALDAFFSDWDEFLAQDHEMLKHDYLDEHGHVIRFPNKYWYD